MGESAHPVLMFLLRCTECGRRELVGSRSIVAFANSSHGGIEVHLRCPSCGHVVAERTGKRREAAAGVESPAAAA